MKRIILNEVLLEVLSLTEARGNDKGRRRKTSIKLNYPIVFKNSLEKSRTTYLQSIVFEGTLYLMTEGWRGGKGLAQVLLKMRGETIFQGF